MFLFDIFVMLSLFPSLSMFSSFCFISSPLYSFISICYLCNVAVVFFSINGPSLCFISCPLYSVVSIWYICNVIVVFFSINVPFFLFYFPNIRSLKAISEAISRVAPLTLRSVIIASYLRHRRPTQSLVFCSQFQCH